MPPPLKSSMAGNDKNDRKGKGAPKGEAFIEGDQQQATELDSASFGAQFFDLSLDMCCVAGFDGYFKKINAAFESTLGYSKGELLANPFLHFVHPDDVGATIAEMGKLSEGALTLYFENRYRCKNGEYKWLAWKSFPYQSNGLIYALARDMTLVKNAEQAIRSQNEWLEAQVKLRTTELEDAQDEIVNRLAIAGEFRDEETGEHTIRVGEMAARIAAVLGMSGDQVRLILLAARLHDIGKIGVSDLILLKPGKLTNDEIADMRRHATLGGRMLSNGRTPLLQMAERIAVTHHEWFDGTGYPAGLAGDEIPIEGRIVALADVFDALTNDRPYKSAWTQDAAITEISSHSGTQFDPRVVDAFLVVVGETGSLAA